MSQKNQWHVWVLMCGDDYGWGADYTGLWGYEPRVYRTRSEACAHRDACRSAGCWSDDEGNEQIPEFYVERMTIFRALEITAIEDEVRAIMPPPGTRIPASVLREAAAECGVASDAYSRSSATLSGSSSATHTHALLAGAMMQRGHEYLELIGKRAVLAGNDEGR